MLMIFLYAFIKIDLSVLSTRQHPYKNKGIDDGGPW